ncbi:Hypothetical protein LUCI_2185 [Lucifera butyrica]|uniref:AI-2E family transporter n=1 Tax=Lucifera butyrica TaxID=1351585 RepID=A0A498R9Y0_9FIRM|nr:AI-2E family transporter [Lucifera butyrica]VBB06943.1 Hypothetical protein LUCI_2185 [Lucifera butyrica]
MINWNWTYAYLVTLVAGIGLIFWLATKLAIVLFIAFLLTLLLRPLADKLKRRMGAGWASILVLTLFLCVFLLFFIGIIRSILPSFAQFATKLPHYINPAKVNLLMVRLNLPSELTEYVNDAFNQVSGFALESLKNAVLPLLHAMSGVVELISIPFIVFYFLKDGEMLRSGLFSLAPAQEQAKLNKIAAAAAQVLSGYIRGQLTVCLFSGLASFIFFIAWGLPFPVVIASLSAFAELIPVVGPVIVACLAASLGLVHSTAAAVKIVIFYIVMLKINHNIITPKLIGKAVHLHPVVIMIGLLFFGHLFGVLGMVMAVSVLAVIRVVILEVHGITSRPAGKELSTEKSKPACI